MKCFIKLAPVYRRGHRFDSIGVASTNGDEDTLFAFGVATVGGSRRKKPPISNPPKSFFVTVTRSTEFWDPFGHQWGSVRRARWFRGPGVIYNIITHPDWLIEWGMLRLYAVFISVSTFRACPHFLLAHTLFTSQGEREKESKRKRKREGEREWERGREREWERGRERERVRKRERERKREKDICRIWLLNLFNCFEQLKLFYF